jgi:hypothetical protein
VLSALAAALLALTAAQAQGAADAPAEVQADETPLPALDAPDPGLAEAATAEETEGTLDRSLPSIALPPPDPIGLSDVLGRDSALQDEDLRRSRVPFLPSAAAPVRNRTGTHLAAGAMAQVRTRNLSAETGFTQWDTDLEVVPGLTLFSYGHRAQFTLSYAPRLYFPAVWHGGPMSVLHRGNARLEWNPSKPWAITLWANGTYGDYSQLVPSSTPGGPGPSPPVLNPIRTFQTYPYLSVDANAQASITFGQRLRLRATAGWFDVGGVGTAGQESQPRTWGPRADATVDVFAGPRAILSTSFAAMDSELVGGASVRIAAGAETWSHRWAGSFDTSVTLGAAWVNNPPTASVTVNHVIPVAGIKMTFVQSSRDLFRLVIEAGLGPYVDTYLQAAYQRLTGRIGAEWFFGKNWKLEASLASALVPFTIRAPESYAVAGASAAWSPWRWTTLLAGGFAQTQLGGASSSNRFVQLTGYLSVSVQTPDLP